VKKTRSLPIKDVAGFVGNRLQHALRREAIAIWSPGRAARVIRRRDKTLLEMVKW
jgi:3-hydroxyacyl-CoA dehydrogenase